MPGISFKCRLSKKDIKPDVDTDELFLSALDSAAYNESYKIEVLLEEDNYLLGSTRYYGKQDEVVSRELDELLNCVFSYNIYP